MQILRPETYQTNPFCCELCGAWNLSQLFIIQLWKLKTGLKSYSFVFCIQMAFHPLIGCPQKENFIWAWPQLNLWIVDTYADLCIVLIAHVILHNSIISIANLAMKQKLAHIKCKSASLTQKHRFGFDWKQHVFLSLLSVGMWDTKDLTKEKKLKSYHVIVLNSFALRTTFMIGIEKRRQVVSGKQSKLRIREKWNWNRKHSHSLKVVKSPDHRI